MLGYEILTGVVWLDILFKSAGLKSLCHDDRLAKRTLGGISAAKLRSRLDDLVAASTLGYAQSLPGRFHALARATGHAFAFVLSDKCLLVFEPANDPVPLLADGSVELTAITIIRVVYVGDSYN